MWLHRSETASAFPFRHGYPLRLCRSHPVADLDNQPFSYLTGPDGLLHMQQVFLFQKQTAKGRSQALFLRVPASVNSRCPANPYVH